MNALRKTESFGDPLSSVTPTVIQLSKLSFFKGIRPLVFDWGVIALTITVAGFFPSTFIKLMATLIIASRQHALLVVVHEGAHYRLAKNHLLNDFLANTFAAFPIFFLHPGLSFEPSETSSLLKYDARSRLGPQSRFTRMDLPTVAAPAMWNGFL